MSSESKFFDDIERLRGFACILVLLQHVMWICRYEFVREWVPTWLSIGSGAVRIFFAISGFVITYSLFDKFEGLNGSFLENLAKAKDWILKFYSKRFFRIFPVVFAVIILLGIFLQITDTYVNWELPLLRTPIEILFGTFNNSVELFVKECPIYSSGVGPFWTLAVESQFYLFWPLVLLACKNNNQRAVLSLSLGIILAVIVTPLSNFYLGAHYYWTSNNISELFLGSFLAYAYKSGVDIKISDKSAKLVAVFFAFAIWFYPSVILGMRKIFYGDLIETFCSVILVMLCVFNEGCFKFLGIDKVFRYLGQRSFSFYSIQLTLANIVVWFFDSSLMSKNILSKNEFFFYQFLIFIVSLLIGTELLYRFIERPFRKFGR